MQFGTNILYIHVWLLYNGKPNVYCNVQFIVFMLTQSKYFCCSIQLFVLYIDLIGTELLYFASMINWPKPLEYGSDDDDYDDDDDGGCAWYHCPTYKHKPKHRPKHACLTMIVVLWPLAFMNVSYVNFFTCTLFFHWWFMLMAAVRQRWRFTECFTHRLLFDDCAFINF